MPDAVPPPRSADRRDELLQALRLRLRHEYANPNLLSVQPGCGQATVRKVEITAQDSAR
jgi:hypothetical protein